MFTSLLFLCLKKACTHSSMMELKKCLITVVLNVQNFGKCLSFNVSSVAGLIEKEYMLQNKKDIVPVKCGRYI